MTVAKFLQKVEEIRRENPPTAWVVTGATVPATALG